MRSIVRSFASLALAGLLLHFHGSNGTYAIDGLVFPGLPPAQSL